MGFVSHTGYLSHGNNISEKDEKSGKIRRISKLRNLNKYGYKETSLKQDLNSVKFQILKLAKGGTFLTINNIEITNKVKLDINKLVKCNNK